MFFFSRLVQFSMQNTKYSIFFFFFCFYNVNPTLQAWWKLFFWDLLLFLKKKKTTVKSKTIQRSLFPPWSEVFSFEFCKSMCQSIGRGLFIFSPPPFPKVIVLNTHYTLVQKLPVFRDIWLFLWGLHQMHQNGFETFSPTYWSDYFMRYEQKTFFFKTIHPLAPKNYPQKYQRNP